MARSKPEVKVVQDTNKALDVMRDAGKWLHDTGKNRSEWWDPKNFNMEFFGPYAKPDEFYVALAGGVPAAAAIIQEHQSLQDWSAVDGKLEPKALYVHYLSVKRDFAGQNLPQVFMEFAVSLAQDKGIKTLRLDTNAAESKLRRIYEYLGFSEVKIIDEGARQTVLYEKKV